MAGRETADIVFCMDASGSMSNAFNGVRSNVIKLVKSLEKASNLQQKWDVRFDFLAYSNHGGCMRLHTVKCNGQEVIDNIYNVKADANNGKADQQIFTRDIHEFQKSLDNIVTAHDESTGLALDMCADFPFRDSSSCHRVVILLTDEPIRTGVYSSQIKKYAMDIAKKYQDRKIMLFMVTPDCEVFDMLSQIDKCEWTIDSSEGLKNIDFTKLLEGIGKSVSVSQNSISSNNEIKPLFNESNWVSTGDRALVEVLF